MPSSLATAVSSRQLPSGGSALSTSSARNAEREHDSSPNSANAAPESTSTSPISGSRLPGCGRPEASRRTCSTCASVNAINTPRSPLTGTPAPERHSPTKRRPYPISSVSSGPPVASAVGITLEQPDRHQRRYIPVRGAGVHVQHPREVRVTQIAPVRRKGREHHQARQQRPRQPRVIQPLKRRRKRLTQVRAPREKHRHAASASSRTHHRLNLRRRQLDHDAVAARAQRATFPVHLGRGSSSWRWTRHRILGCQRERRSGGAPRGQDRLPPAICGFGNLPVVVSSACQPVPGAWEHARVHRWPDNAQVCRRPHRRRTSGRWIARSSQSAHRGSDGRFEGRELRLHPGRPHQLGCTGHSTPCCCCARDL